MRTREYKCYYCKKQIKTNEELIENKTKSGKVSYRMHKTCFDFKEREKDELDNLVETIKKMYNIEIIPSSFYIRLQDLRNGNDIYNKVKKSKNGYRYKLIEYTYKKKHKEIKKSISTIKGGSLNQLNYGLAIVRNSINDIVLELRALRKRKKELDKIRDEVIIEESPKEIVVGKKEVKKLPDWL